MWQWVREICCDVKDKKESVEVSISKRINVVRRTGGSRMKKKGGAFVVCMELRAPLEEIRKPWVA